ncbi:MAG TPA: hypothetical protein VJB69_02715 [Candidatus Paceibacterota bacterium]
MINFARTYAPPSGALPQTFSGLLDMDLNPNSGWKEVSLRGDKIFFDPNNGIKIGPVITNNGDGITFDVAFVPPETASLKILNQTEATNWVIGQKFPFSWTTIPSATSTLVNFRIIGPANVYSEREDRYSIFEIKNIPNNGSNYVYIPPLSPSTPSKKYLYQIYTNFNPLYSIGDSSGFFNVTLPTQPTIAVSQPRGGEIFDVGATTIRARATMYLMPNPTNMSIRFKNQLNEQVGQDYVGLSRDIITPAFPSGTYKLEFRATTNGQSVVGYSNNFYIKNTTPPPPTITVVYPNSSRDILYQGKSYTLRWSSANLSATTSVQIEFIPRDSTQSRYTVAGTANTGSYTFNLRDTKYATPFPAGYYLMEVRAYPTNSQPVFDRSDNLFQILGASSR